VLIAILMVFAIKRPALLGPMANPSDSTYLPRPEWYYLPIFDWLKLWPGRSIIVGIVIIPAIVVGLLFGLSFIDRKPERRPWRRPISRRWIRCRAPEPGRTRSPRPPRRSADPDVHEKLLAQDEGEVRFAQAPFQPEEPASAGKRAGGPRALARGSEGRAPSS